MSAQWSRREGYIENVTLGEDMAQTLARRGVTPGRITLIPNWAPRELQQPALSAAIACACTPGALA